MFTEINQRAGLFDDETALSRLESMASSHAMGRIGEVGEIAEAVEYLITAEGPLERCWMWTGDSGWG